MAITTKHPPAIDTPDALLAEWKGRVEQALFSYNAGVNQARRHQRIVGYLTVALTTTAGTLTFATITGDPSFGYRLAVGLVSAAAAVLASVHAFADFDKRAEAYQAAARRFAQARRLIEERRLELRIDGQDVRGILDEARLVIDHAAEESPNAPERIWDSVRRWLKQNPGAPP